MKSVLSLLRTLPLLLLLGIIAFGGKVFGTTGNQVSSNINQLKANRIINGMMVKTAHADSPHTTDGTGTDGTDGTDAADAGTDAADASGDDS